MFRDKLEFRYLQSSMSLLDERKTLNKKLQVLSGMCFRLTQNCIIIVSFLIEMTDRTTLPSSWHCPQFVKPAMMLHLIGYRSLPSTNQNFRMGSNFIFHHHFIQPTQKKRHSNPQHWLRTPSHLEHLSLQSELTTSLRVHLKLYGSSLQLHSQCDRV